MVNNNKLFSILGLFFLFSLIIILIGCVSEKTETETAPKELLAENQTLPLEQPSPEDYSEDSSEEGSCLPGWKCLNKWDKAYQFKNCSWTERTECPLGCENNTCRAGKTCTSGFRCIDETKQGYLTETCLWIKVKKCDFGCEKDSCNPPPENYTEQTEEPETGNDENVEESPKEEIKKLSLNEEITLEINSNQYFLQLYNMEPSQVMLKIDGFKTEWLPEGINYTHSSGFVIDIKEILYQAYPGGKKEMNYVIR